MPQPRLQFRTSTSCQYAWKHPHGWRSQFRRVPAASSERATRGLLLAPVDTLSAGKDYYKYVEAEVDFALSEGKTVLMFFRAGHNLAKQDAFLASVQYKVFSCQFESTTELFQR